MFAAAFVVAAVMATTVSVLATEPTAPKPIVVKDKVTVKATIEAIDTTNRTVTLKGPKGNLLTLTVDESVDRFNAMKVGDRVKADYYESVAYEVQKPGAAAPPDTITAGAGRLSGEKPGGAVMETTVTTVTIEAIDLETPAVTIRTSDGATQSFRVRKRKNLEGVKVGDRVQVTQTSALMIAVEAAP
jgi:Cu/Ag efflux protein CusF